MINNFEMDEHGLEEILSSPTKATRKVLADVEGDIVVLGAGGKMGPTLAMMLKKADAIPNDSGSALGMHYLNNNTHIFIMPGVPSEMREMVP